MNKLLSFDKNKVLNYLFVLYSFCIPLSRAGIVLLAVLITFFWIIEGNFKNKIRDVISSKFLMMGIILCLYLMMGVFWADNNDYTFNHFKRLWYYIPMFTLFTSLKKEYIVYIISAFVSAMMISEVISYGIFFELWTTKHGTPSDPTPFMNHLEYSLFLAFISSYLLVKSLLERLCLKTKIVYIIFFITACTNLFITGGRIGQLAFVFSIFMIIITHVKHKIKALFISIILIFTILFTAYTFSSTFKNRISNSISDLNKVYVQKDFSSSWGLRLSTWVVTYNILKDNLIFGTSIADIQNDYLELITVKKIVNVENVQAIIIGGYHNDFLELSAGGGIIASMLFIVCFLYLMRLKLEDEELNNIKIILMSIFIVALIGDNFLRLQFTMNLFGLFTGIIIASARMQKINTISI